MHHEWCLVVATFSPVAAAVAVPDILIWFLIASAVLCVLGIWNLNCSVITAVSTVSCEIGDPGSPFSWENRDLGPYFHNILGPGSLFSQEIGDLLMKMGTPSAKTVLDIDCAAWLFVTCCLALYPSIQAVRLLLYPYRLVTYGFRYVWILRSTHLHHDSNPSLSYTHINRWCMAWSKLDYIPP